ncbi:MAG: hypothetical protein GY832_24275 [Chloroflexi bacterium]|nr:hypothetical protein [Chloroflexota bacterium]
MKLILKNVRTTKLMQALDMHEPFKFIGKVMDAPGTLTKSIEETLVALHNASKGEPVVVVGLIVNSEAAVIEGHKTYSTGEGWCTIEELCRHHGASNMVVVSVVPVVPVNTIITAEIEG